MSDAPMNLPHYDSIEEARAAERKLRATMPSEEHKGAAYRLALMLIAAGKGSTADTKTLLALIKEHYDIKDYNPGDAARELRRLRDIAEGNNP